eukprot:m.308452 g.308452  ORF g.308452 m.308452 type:complete len:555 (+) comp44030_c0_seq1:601-2265(+)
MGAENSTESSPSVFRRIGKRKSAVSEANTYYDIILRCNPSMLENDGRWNVDFPNGREVMSNFNWSGVAVGIMGNFNRGKTWFMSRLTGYPLPDQGLTKTTEGLSFKWVKDAITKSPKETAKPIEEMSGHVVIDSAGMHSPVNLRTESQGPHDDGNVAVDPEKTTSGEDKNREKKVPGSNCPENGESVDEIVRRSDKEEKIEAEKNKQIGENFLKRAQESEQYDEFLQNMTLRLADCVFVVMNETTYQDQSFLHRVVNEWVILTGNGQLDRKSDVIYVVHNFWRITDVGQRNELFKKSTKLIYPGASSVDSTGVPYFSFVREDFKTQHVCLMQDKGEGRTYNDAVFSLLNRWIKRSILPVGRRNSPALLINRFKSAFTQINQKGKYLANVKTLDSDSKELDLLAFFPIKENEGEKVERNIMGFDTCEKGFDPPVHIFSYTSEAGTKCKVIQLEIPDVAKVHVKLKEKESIAQHCAIEVTGKKKTRGLTEKLKKFAQIEENPKLKPKSSSEDIQANSLCYGRFSKIFQIHLDYSTTCVKVWPGNGIVLLVFESATD